jgi:hypothetical protein
VIPPPEKPKPTAGSILWGVAFGAIALLIFVPIGLCTSLFGGFMVLSAIFGDVPDKSVWPYVLVSLPVLVMIYFIVRTAIRIGRGEHK